MDYLIDSVINISGEEFCNAIIHGQLNSDGKPLRMHKTIANETHPAIISCWVKRLDLSSHARYNPVLRLLISKREEFKSFRAMPVHEKGLYNISYSQASIDSSNTDYNLAFEYTMYMFDDSVDYTVATCGITYHTPTTNITQCWSPAFTLIRYDSPIEDCPGQTIITTSSPTSVATTKTTSTATTGETLTTTSVPSVTKISNTYPTPTVIPPSGTLIAGFSSAILILILMVVLLLLAAVILWVKLRSVSADRDILQTNYDELTRKNEGAASDSEGELDKKSTQKLKE